MDNPPGQAGGILSLIKRRFGLSLCAYNVSGGNEAGFSCCETGFSTQEIWDLVGTVLVRGLT